MAAVALEVLVVACTCHCVSAVDTSTGAPTWVAAVAAGEAYMSCTVVGVVVAEDALVAAACTFAAGTVLVVAVARTESEQATIGSSMLPRP